MTKTLLSLFDYSGQWSAPFADAGWMVVQVDIRHQTRSRPSASTARGRELLGYMTAQVPSVDPLIQAWSLRHCRGRRLSFGPGEVRSAFRPIEKRCVCG